MVFGVQRYDVGHFKVIPRDKPCPKKPIVKDDIVKSNHNVPI